ncbi:uncharacterized protein LOC131221402 [Magnolia sinica]|uniref:uncharacterized protein LOC131221402 n=1 Tax=Magnolia sinica TaxID=86752 RepID=UPI002659BB6E|nr:uncharacterized protein LOC131221402 [Magnolia sinica]XP_058072647.1 uncharacterized protein LOC131221402 [Magnolia sinica]
MFTILLKRSSTCAKGCFKTFEDRLYQEIRILSTILLPSYEGRRTRTRYSCSNHVSYRTSSLYPSSLSLSLYELYAKLAFKKKGAKLSAVEFSSLCTMRYFIDTKHLQMNKDSIKTKNLGKMTPPDTHGTTSICKGACCASLEKFSRLATNLTYRGLPRLALKLQWRWSLSSPVSAPRAYQNDYSDGLPCIGVYLNPSYSLIFHYSTLVNKISFVGDGGLYNFNISTSSVLLVLASRSLS